MYEISVFQELKAASAAESVRAALEVTMGFDEQFAFDPIPDVALIKKEIQSIIDSVSGGHRELADAVLTRLAALTECNDLGVRVTEEDKNGTGAEFARTEEYVPVILGLGSNKGDKLRNIEKAVELLTREGMLLADKASSYYESRPAGFSEQDDFVNIVIKGRTQMAPEALLVFVKDIESKLGREWSKRNRPRVIDIDILYYGRRRIISEALEIPHRRIHERAFVLEPLREIAPRFKDPLTMMPLKGGGSEGGIIGIIPREE